ncbi:MAG: hypothetical protein O2794_03040 [bacterium]|nr:hypothetical protein [bacterium]
MKKTVAILFALILGCGGGGGSSDGNNMPPPESTPTPELTLVSVIDHGAGWDIVDQADDCTPSSYGVEDVGGVIGWAVITDDCHSITVEQNTVEYVDGDEDIHIRFFHDDLSIPFGTTGVPEDPVATVWISVNGVEVWRTLYPIPSGFTIDEITVQAPQSFQVGSPIQIHVENHGDNEYALLEVGVYR